MSALLDETAGSLEEPAVIAAWRAPRLKKSTEVWLIRHGATEWSVSGQHTGRTDIPLTPEGEAQALALRPMVRRIKPALVLASPRTRAQRTAELAGLTVDDIDADLSEWDYGDYEGITTKEIRKTVPGWTVFSHPCPNGETAAQVAARADRVLDRVVRAVDEGPVVLVAHGHISRVIGARWIGLGPECGINLILGTAAPSLLGAEHGRPAIKQWNMPNPATQ